MREQRKTERKRLQTFTPIYDFDKDTLLGYLGDLTIQGAMLVGDKPMEINKKVTLAIEFHETPEIPAARMTIPVRVAWCNHEEHSNSYKTGVEFLELTNRNRIVIAAVLERYQFREVLPS